MIPIVKLLKLARFPGYFSSLSKGVAAGIEHERLLRTLKCRTVIDIGANRGQFALVARHCFPEARIIISFEPLKIAADKFRAVFKNDDRVVLHQVAVGPQSGETTIHVSGRDDSSSLLPITGLQDTLFPGTAEKGTEQIRVAPLGEFVSQEEIERPALLKLDVQGYELEALKGCEDLLDCFDYVYAECSFVELYEGQAMADEVIAYLQGYGFHLQGVHNMAYDRQGRAIQGDFLFSIATARTSQST